MRVALIPSADLSYESGSVLFALQLYRYLVRTGHSVTILGSSPPTVPWRVEARDLSLNTEILEHPVITDRPVSSDELHRSAELSLQFLIEQHRGNRIDIVYAQYLSFGSYAAVAFARITGIPVVISCFGRDLTVGFVASPEIKIFGDAAARGASAIVVPNKEVKRRLEREYSDLASNLPTHLIRSPVDPTFDLCGPRCIDTKSSISILTINSCFKPEKGLDTVLSAFYILGQKHPEAVLYIAGADDHPRQAHMQRISSQVESLGLCDRVVFTGYLTRREVVRYLHECDIFVDGRHVCNFSSVMIEAQFARVPTVASSTVGSREVIRHGVNGMLFRPGDAEALFQQLRQLVENPDQRKSLSDACGHWVKSEGFSYREECCFNELELLFYRLKEGNICD